MQVYWRLRPLNLGGLDAVNCLSVFVEFHSLSMCDNVCQCLCGIVQLEPVRRFPCTCAAVVAILAGVHQTWHRIFCFGCHGGLERLIMEQRRRSWHPWPRRVIGVLQDLHTKVTANASAEVKAFNACTKRCKDQPQDHGHQQETPTASDASANPAIKNDVANARSPSEEISSLASQIALSDPEAHRKRGL